MNLFYEEEESFPRNYQYVPYDVLPPPNLLPPAIKPTTDEREQPEQNQPEPKLDKTKPLAKSEKKGAPQGRKGKKKKDSSMGRPPNQETEKQHLRESKSYNDIFYHNARFLIFLKLEQQSPNPHFTMHLSNQESQWMSQTQSIMSKQNFPQYNKRTQVFLLHPVSLHYVFQYRKKMTKKMNYEAEEVKFMFLAYLKKKELLSNAVFHYINEYWTDIIELVNNPQGQPQLPISLSGSEQSLNREGQGNSWNNNEGDFEEINEMNGGSQRVLESGSGSDMSRNGTKKEDKKKSELEQLRQEQKEDESIVAYEIACYLHACMVKFWFTISPSK